MIGGQAGIVGHVEIGDQALIGAQSGVARDVPGGGMVSGSPAVEHHAAMRGQALVPRLPTMRHEIKQMIKDIEDLKAQLKAKG